MAISKGYRTSGSNRQTEIKSFFDGLKVCDSVLSSYGESIPPGKSDISHRWKQHLITVLNTASLADKDIIAGFS